MYIYICVCIYREFGVNKTSDEIRRRIQAAETKQIGELKVLIAFISRCRYVYIYIYV